MIALSLFPRKHVDVINMLPILKKAKIYQARLQYLREENAVEICVCREGYCVYEYIHRVICVCSLPHKKQSTKILKLKKINALIQGKIKKTDNRTVQ